MLHKLERLPKVVAGRRTPLMLGTIALVALGGGGIYLQQQQAAQQTAKAQSIAAATKSVPTTVTALGKLAPKGEVIKLSAPTSNEGVKIDKLLVEEGATVKAGQLIAILDSQGRLQAAVNEAKAKVSVNSLPGELQGTIDRVGIQVKRQNTIDADPSSNIDDRVVEVHAVLNPESSRMAAKFTNLQIQAVINLN